MHGRCRPDQAPRTDRRSAGTLEVAERPPHERLTDADREVATDLLSAAFRDGVLHVDEFDQRLTAALSAQVAGDLVPVTADLPAQWLAERQAAQAAAQRAAKHRRRWSAEVRTYARVMALLWAIWLVIALTGEGMHSPWPVWPTLGWGIPLFLGRPTGPAARTVRRLRAAREY
jgi:hypothetical protein